MTGSQRMCTGGWSRKLWKINLFLSLASVQFATSGQAASPPPNRAIINVPAQNLAEALTQVGRLTGSEIIFNPADVRSKRARAIRGRHDARSAIALLLRGTGLSAREAAGAFIIFADPRADARATQTADSEVVHGLDDIIVTATRRSQLLQNVPVSVTALSPLVLAPSSIQVAAELPRLIPNLTIRVISGSYVAPYIRGVGTQLATPGLEPSVPVYFDNMFIARPSAAMLNFSDIDRIEILKGPQGTLYGRNAVGGAIRIITKDPEPGLSLAQAVTFGSFNRLGLDTVANIPITADLLARISYFHDERDGYVKSIVDPKERFEDRNVDMIRGKLSLDKGTLRIKLSADYNRKVDRESNSLINDDRAPLLLGEALGGRVSDGFYRTAQAIPPEPFKLTIWGGELRADYDLEDAIFSSITGYRSIKFQGIADVDTTDLDLLNASDHPQFTKDLSQEFQIVSDRDDKISYIAGVYLFHERTGTNYNVFGALIAPGADVLTKVVRIRTFSIAPYADFTFPLADRLELSLGARYTFEVKRSQPIQLLLGPLDSQTQIAAIPEEKLKFKRFTPKIGLNFKPNDELLLYALYSKGFKSGGFNIQAFSGATQNTVDPENIAAYEIGWKYAAGSIRFNGAVFYYDERNLAVTLTRQAQTVIENAATARTYGLEGELEAKITPRLTLNAGAGLLNAKYRRYVGSHLVPNPAGPGYIQEQGNFSGNPLPNAPKFTANMRLSYDLPAIPVPGSVKLNLLVNHAGKSYFSADSRVTDPGQTLIGAAATWKSAKERLQISVTGDNITNKKYYLSRSSNDIGTFYVPAAPRTIAVKVGIRF